MSQLDCLTERTFRSLAGDRWFARGRVYQQEGRVTSLTSSGDSLSARVVGTQTYRVRLSCKNSRISYACSCPVGDDGNFCKHCVAVGLEWLEQDTTEQVATQKPRGHGVTQTTEQLAPVSRRRSEGSLKSFLDSLGQEALVELVLIEAARSRRFRERIELEAARVRPAGIDLAQFKKAITSATRTGDIDYHSMPRFARRVLEVIESIRSLLHDGHAPAVVELTEYFFSRLEKAIGEVDDSDGYFGDIIPDLRELHHEACLLARENPVKLAQRLFKWELEGGWDLFSTAAENYANVLGDAGLKEYRRLTEEAWSQVPPLEPGDDANQRWGNRFRITSMMETLATQAGDVNALIEIKQRDLAHPFSFLQIAELYRDAKRFDEALEWAERGAHLFPSVDSRISDFLATEYHRRGRHREAMDLIWKQFVERPSVQMYAHLHEHALQVKSPRDKLRLVSTATAGAAARQASMVSDSTSEWTYWRELALRHIREQVIGSIPAGKANLKPVKISSPFETGRDHSLLVQVFLYEQNFEEAWDEASSGGCENHLWLRLADAISKEHADRAYLVYKELIAPALNQTNDRSYSEAIELLTKMSKLTSRLGNESEYDDYLVALRVEFKRKRNFIKMLDRMTQ